MLKNKKGFTLIELLVAIAIMISITVVAIISITKIGEQNKKQAYELVKDQVKTAALEYFSANEYWFEGLENGSTGYITVTKLVEERYLNSLTNPTTGEKLNGCDYVEVKKTDNGYQYNFLTDNSGTCKDNNSLTVMEPNAPAFTLKATCDSNSMNSDDWCNKDVTISLVLSEADKINIISKEYELSNSSVNQKGIFDDANSNFIDEYESGSKDGTTLTATVSNGKQATKTITYKIDKTRPECEINANGGNIKNPYNKMDAVNFELINRDALSGVKNKCISTNQINNITNNIDTLSLNDINSNSFTLYGKVVDVAGNEKSCNPQSIVVVAPKCETKVVSTDDDIKNGWDNGQEAPVIELYVNDEYKTSEIATEGDKIYTFNDNYGCGYNPTVNVKYDKTGPVLNYINVKNAGLSSTTSWSSENASYDVKTYDQHSGVDTNGVSRYLRKGLFLISWNSNLNINNSELITSTGKFQNNSVVLEDNAYVIRNLKIEDNGQKMYTYKVCDKAGNCTENSIYANIDKTVPTVDLIMKKKNDSDTLYPESNISGLSNYSNNEIYNGYVFTKTSYTAGPSGATVTCSDTNYDNILGGTHGPYNNFATYRNVNREGVTTIRCTATSGAGIKSSEITKTIKLERKLKMVLNEERMRNVTSVTNGKLVFNTNYSGVKYYSTTNYMGCNKYSSSNPNGCKLGGSFDEGYYGFIATACKNVGGYERHFTIDSPVDWGINTWLYDYEESADDTLYGIIYDNQNANYLRTCTNLTSSFNTNCGNKTTGTPNFTTHRYYYQSYSGATSNEVILYTKYTIECGYIK